MSEVASRPAQPRGRGAGRGGRGGARGSIRGRGQANGTYKDTPDEVDDFADQGELGDMKKQYSSQLPLLKELFSDWTEVDLLFALQETDGDLESTIERISEGPHSVSHPHSTPTNLARRSRFKILRCQERQGEIEAQS
jgi:hypothetical protein